MNNQNCPYDEVIKSETECIEASEMLGLSFRRSISSTNAPAGCFYNTNNQKSNFNTILDIATTSPGRYGYFTGVCKKKGNHCYQ